MSETYQSHVSASTPPVGGLIPFFGLPCMLLSIYPDAPGCYGGISSTTCCCLQIQSAFCKPTTRSNSYCVCTSQETELLHFAPILKSSTQCWMFDSKMSFPPDENNPCLLNICFCTIIHNNAVKMKFFKTVSEL
mmetsp:Transcript_117453/g.230482  ORF Transcript_117453/g.230482 Transcript_117453/m.230482 type:complete len:134 (+) Transcript_117453:51-452(+)